MTWLWIPLCLMAALVQSVRTAGQKQLSLQLKTTTVTMVRFLFGLPFVLAYMAIVLNNDATALPPISTAFVTYCLIAAIGQILATVLLIYLFSLRNFAVGTTYARTEAFLTALIGATFFGELIGLAGWIAILTSVAGVVLITIARTGLGGGSLLTRLGHRAAAAGLGAGLLFSIGSLAIRQASLSLGDPRFLLTAGMTLTLVVLIQVSTLGVYMMLREPGQFIAMARHWRLCALIGLTSAVGSIGWFTAMTIQRAAYVKALAQVEFIFTLAISLLFFRERTSPKELAGMTLVAAGIVFLLLYG